MTVKKSNLTQEELDRIRAESCRVNKKRPMRMRDKKKREKTNENARRTGEAKKEARIIEELRKKGIHI